MRLGALLDVATLGALTHRAVMRWCMVVCRVWSALRWARAARMSVARPKMSRPMGSKTWPATLQSGWPMHFRLPIHPALRPVAIR
jgi:hypothetical protein